MGATVSVMPPAYTETPASINGARVRPAVADFYGVLARAYPNHASLDRIASGVWGYTNVPDTYLKSIMVYACSARKALIETGWNVENVYGEGYRLTRRASSGINDE